MWNLTTRDLAEQMNLSSAPLPPGVSEFERAGLATAPSRIVQVPRVAASPVSFECRRSQIIQLQSAAGEPVDSWLILGEVVGVHIDETLLVNGIYDTAAARPVLRGGGASDYFELGELFRMSRPKA